MNGYTSNLKNKLEIAVTQVETIEEEIEKIREMYAKWRNESGMKLEILINRLRATKAAMDEEVNEEESMNLEKLKKIKTSIQNQLERWRIVTNLADATRARTRHQSQLMELKSGLYQQAEELSAQGIYVESYSLTTPYISEETYEYTEDEQRQLIRPVTYENTHKVIDQFVDLEQYLKNNFEHTLTVEISNEWCNRINILGQLINIGVDNTIQLYNTAGACVNSYNNVHETIIVKQANNGDVIAAGFDGLYVTKKDFSQWTLLREGMYSDI
jgi:chromosome segregation ATPase